MAFKAYLLDIEGTTTPIDFVTKTLFPYARRELASFVSQADEALLADCVTLSAEYSNEVGAPEWPLRPSPDGVVSYLEWLMDQDRKSTGLKSIQGRIWEAGYRSGDLVGEVYPDVEPAMKRWAESGASVNIFSSGSVLAQKLIFGNAKDVRVSTESHPLPRPQKSDPSPSEVEGLSRSLSHYISHYFDTTTGPKREASSYLSIAKAIGFEPSEVLFLSDIQAEVDAAREAGMAAELVTRDGNGGLADFSGLV